MLAREGFKQGDCLHLVIDNHCLYQVLVLAAWKLGGTASCADTGLKNDTFKFQIEELRAKFVVCSTDTHSEVAEAVSSLSQVNLLSIGPVQANHVPGMPLNRSVTVLTLADSACNAK